MRYAEAGRRVDYPKLFYAMKYFRVVSKKWGVYCAKFLHKGSWYDKIINTCKALY